MSQLRAFFAGCALTAFVGGMRAHIVYGLEAHEYLAAGWVLVALQIMLLAVHYRRAEA